MSEIFIIYMTIGLFSYLVGAIPCGVIIGELKGIDIRKHGSGNIGATNVSRVLGKKWGIACFILDFMKGLIPVLTVKLLLSEGILLIPYDYPIIIAAFASVSGHIWSIFLRFKGGKGIATGAGTLLAIAPFSLLSAGIIWITVFYSSRYVSLASITAAIFLPLSAFVFSQTGIFLLPSSIQILLTALMLLVILRHKSNLKRLLTGTENRF